MHGIHVDSPHPELEIVSSRLFAQPASLLFAAFTDGRRLARWWGPKDFRSTFHEFDPQPGGRWRFTMHGPDGTDYPNESQFLEVVPPRRLVLRHLSGPEFKLTVTFADEHGGTRVTWRMEFATARLCARVRRYAAPANEESFERLAALVASRTPARRAAPGAVR